MDKDTVAISIKLDRETHKRIKLFAVEKETSFKDLFLVGVGKLMAEEEDRKKTS